MLKIALFISGLIVFVATVASLLLFGFSYGYLPIFFLSGLAMLYGLYYERLVRIKWFTYGVLALCAFYVVTVVFIGVHGQSDNVTYGEDAVIVLGAGIKGERVTRMLSYRLDRAVEYSRSNPGAFIVVSGGQGPGETITEAVAMERYLIEKGAPAEKIIREERSTSTYENLLFSKEILDDMFQDQYKAAVITNDFHIFRAEKIAKNLGMHVMHCHAAVDWYSVPVNYSREFLAVLSMLLWK